MAPYVRRRFFDCFMLLCGSFAIVQVTLLFNQQRCSSPDGRTNTEDRDMNTNVKRSDDRIPRRGRPRETAHEFPLETTSADGSDSLPFHRRYDVDCSAIFAGDADVIQGTYRMLKQERQRHSGSIVVPADRQVRTWTRDCDAFRRLRRYPTRTASEEEASYPLAYIIVVHKEAAQVERLLRTIYQPQNLYCIHPDAKSSEDFQRAITGLADCFENVFIASKIEDVQYAGFTRLLADINCMRDLVGPRGNAYRWRYVMNLCGQDMPLKTNLEIVRQLKAYRGHNDITGVLPPPHIVGRTRYHHVVRDKQVRRTRRTKTAPPHDLRIHFGNAYYAATRRFAEYVLTSPEATDLLGWSRDTFSPDEHYWATLQRAPGTPGGYPDPTWDENVRFMKWGDIARHPACRGVYVRGLCVFGSAYLEYLARQPHLFANKFHYSFDPVAMQCVEEALLNRTRSPALSDELPNFPVTNLIWQRHTALP